MAEENLYKWTDNPTVSGVAKCDTDVLNDCLMHLKYDNENPNILKTNQITNCLLEVPQNIKLELADGVLTLKAGSKVIVPNGFEADGTTPKFDEVVIESDITGAFGNGVQKMVFLNPNKTSINNATVSTQTSSGANNSSTSSFVFWYDTTNNFVKFSSNSGSTWTNGFSLPICLVNGNDNVVTSIDRVFNGFGYIGSTVWVDKGVKGLASNGRNTDSTLNNTKFTTQKVLVATVDSSITFNNGIGRVLINSTGTGLLIRIGSYDAVNNYVLGANGVEKLYGCVVLDNMYITNGRINSFDSKLPFRAVDYNDFANTPHITQTYVNGTSWYRVYSDGWCEQGGIYTGSSASNAVATINLLKAYKDKDYCITATKLTDDSINQYMYGIRVVKSQKTTTSFQVRPDSTGGMMWQACGYIA